MGGGGAEGEGRRKERGKGNKDTNEVAVCMYVCMHYDIITLFSSSLSLYNTIVYNI